MITIVITTYNEKDNLPRLVDEIFSLPIAKELEILVVDDNSPDGTGKIAEQLKKKYKRIHVIHRKGKGRGSAGIRGFKEALKRENKYIMEMDADFSHDPKDIPEFIKQIRNCDVVIGSRYAGGEILDRSIYRNAMSTLANFYNKTILRLEVRDIGSGYKCYRRKVIASLDFDKFISTGYSIGPELIYKIKKQGFKMKEIPITFKNRNSGSSKLTMKIMADYLVKVIMIRLGK